MIKTQKIILRVLFIGMTATLLSFQLPDGWLKSGSKPTSYDMMIDKGAGQDGKNVATIKSNMKEVHGYGTLMQKSSPQKFLGKRIRMTGFAKSAYVREIAGLALRIDQENTGQPLSFDNMSDRPITGTTDWKKYEIVLDVPLNASNMSYGAFLRGTGQIWFDNLNFEIVDSTVAKTGRMREGKDPYNLNFEK